MMLAFRRGKFPAYRSARRGFRGALPLGGGAVTLSPDEPGGRRRVFGWYVRIGPRLFYAWRIVP